MATVSWSTHAERADSALRTVVHVTLISTNIAAAATSRHRCWLSRRRPMIWLRRTAPERPSITSSRLRRGRWFHLAAGRGGFRSAARVPRMVAG